MAKNFKTGIDNIFSPTTPQNPPKGDLKEVEEVTATTVETVVTEKSSEVVELPKAATENVLVGYHIRYPKELQKRIKLFCIEHDGIDMKDVFTQGAMMYLDKYQ